MDQREMVKELMRARFSIVRINSILASEGRTNHTLLAVQVLLDDELDRFRHDDDELPGR